MGKYLLLPPTNQPTNQRRPPPDKAERARECVRALNQGTIRTLGHRKRSWVILPHEIFSIDTTTPSLLNLIRWRYDDILGYLVESLSSGLTGNPRSSQVMGPTRIGPALESYSFPVCL